MFRNREEAGLRLAWRLQGHLWRDPLVLAIPRGGVVVGAVLAQELNAELDVVLARKLRAPGQPELAVGAVAERGQVHFCPAAEQIPGITGRYVAEEIEHQQTEIDRRSRAFRAVRPPAVVVNRSVILTDDGVATGSTMIAALLMVRQLRPHELIVAVPVISPKRIEEIRRMCDQLIYLLAPPEFMAIGEYYQDFTEVGDETVAGLLRPFAPMSRHAEVGA